MEVGSSLPLDCTDLSAFLGLIKRIKKAELAAKDNKASVMQSKVWPDLVSNIDSI